MPIKKLTETGTDISIEWQCGCCGCEETRTANVLSLGHSLGSEDPLPNVDLVVLAPCPDCASFEYLNRTWDEVPAEVSAANTPFYRHRCAVNKLARHLKEAGLSQEDCRAAHAAEASNPPEEADISSPFETNYTYLGDGRQ